MNSYNHSKGFTLSEVLITLGIIGVVAAYTIPTLMINYQKTQYVAGLKKAYTNFNQALANMASDAGCPGDLSCFFDYGYNGTSYVSSKKNDLIAIGDKMSAYFSVAKNCKVDTVGCFAHEVANFPDGTGVSTTVPVNEAGGVLG